MYDNISLFYVNCPKKKKKKKNWIAFNILVFSVLLAKVTGFEKLNRI